MCGYILQDDIKGLDISRGQCYNSSVPQNLTFGVQGLPFGVNLGGGKKGAGNSLVFGRGPSHFAILLPLLSVLAAVVLSYAF